MNDLSKPPNLRENHHHRHWYSCKPIPNTAIYVLVSLFFIGLGVSIFILVVVHNAFFFVSLLFLSALVTAFLLWNALNWRRNGSLLLFLHSFPDSDIRLARDGQLVKITGLVSCGNVSLQSSYEKATGCVYTSTLLYESGKLGLRPADVNISCFQWRVTYSERFSTDFYLTDGKSGIRALVKAGPDCKVIPLIVESRLVNTTGECRTLSAHLRKWLGDRNLSAEARLLRLEEGYIKEGSCVSVIGKFRRNDNLVTIVQPSELISIGCRWRKLLLPVDVDGLIIGVSERASFMTNQNSVQRLEQ
ncbi:uncharacterized membrane protein At1g16860-like [Cornus florida]|uniref:uncharacterized membrane protein At1g16860-like n=1 Tax=Cornus florida TaxID=4283 RepID=UPI0028A0E038|nr:uncharacterized membrane protein At1g16860-like [Cornus florida]